MKRRPRYLGNYFFLLIHSDSTTDLIAGNFNLQRGIRVFTFTNYIGSDVRLYSRCLDSSPGLPVI